MTKKEVISINIIFISIFLITASFVVPDNYISENFRFINPIDDIKTSSTFYDIIIDDLSANNWTWAKDQGYCTGSGTLYNPYIIQNHSFRITNENASLTIRNSIKYFEIKNCIFLSSESHTIKGTGLYLSNVTNGLIKESSLNYFVTCLSLKNSNQIRINESYFVSSEDGLYFENSHYNEVEGCWIYDNNGTGLYLDSSNHNTFRETVCGPQNQGMILINSNFNQFIDCYSSNSEIGLGITYGTQNIFLNCIFFYNSIGIDLILTNNNTFFNNDVTGNHYEGIKLTNCSYNIIERNTIENNERDGILSIGSDFNRIISNDIGITIYPFGNYTLRSVINLILSDYNKFENNSIWNFYYDNGISILACVGNNLIDNTIEGLPLNEPHPIKNKGISIEYSSENIIIRNYIWNSNLGIFLNNSDDNLISTNTIQNEMVDSGYDGIIMENSNRNYILDNVMIKVSHCIVEQNCQDNVLIDNICNPDSSSPVLIFLGFLIPSLVLNALLLILFLRKHKKIAKRGE